METMDKRKFEKGQAIMVHRNKVGGGTENVEATFVRAIPKEDRSWISINGKEFRKSNQSIYAVGEEYVSPEKYYKKATRKANKKAVETNKQAEKQAKATEEKKATRKLDTTKEGKKLTKIDRVIIALAKNSKLTAEEALETIECAKSIFNDTKFILDNVGKDPITIAEHNKKWSVGYVEKVWAKFEAAK